MYISVLQYTEILVCYLCQITFTGAERRPCKNLFVSWLGALGLECCLLLSASGFLLLEGCGGLQFAGASAAASSPGCRGGFQCLPQASRFELLQGVLKGVLGLANSAWIRHSVTPHHIFRKCSTFVAPDSLLRN